jgi:hypothetical protein
VKSRSARLGLAVATLLTASHAFAQQDYVGRFDVYGGYAYLNSPHISLAESGFQTQAGVRVWSWMTLGFDFSTETGDTSLTAGLLTTALQQQLGAQLAALEAEGEVPANYVLTMPIHSSTQTYAGGPQFSWHGWSRATLFVRPAVGRIHETATLHPGDPIATEIGQELAPSGMKTDSVIFYGFGGGADVNLSRHVAIRIQADFVHDHLFSDLLKDGRNTVRFGIGPAFQFGGNVKK